MRSDLSKTVVGHSSGAGVFIVKMELIVEAIANSSFPSIAVENVNIGVGVDGRTAAGNARAGVEVEAEHVVIRSNQISATDPLRPDLAFPVEVETKHANCLDGDADLDTEQQRVCFEHGCVFVPYLPHRLASVFGWGFVFVAAPTRGLCG